MALPCPANTFAASPMSEILIKDYWYELPPDRIAQYPLAERDQSRLLHYKNGIISHNRFYEIADLLPEKSTLFFNDTKVIPARLLFQKDTGAIIEIFLLSPVVPSSIVQQAMEAKGKTQWICTVGNLKRWPANAPLVKTMGGITVTASLLNREQGLVEFTWPGSGSFAEIIDTIGFTPLPPYLNRAAENIDRTTYQTVYSKHEGAVAAPTAGLHFTHRVLEDLQVKGHRAEFLTLHVSAGTFQPVKVEKAIEHTMHKEQVVITRKNIEAMLSAWAITAVGTTSMRTLESIYWYGVKLITDPKAVFHIAQADPYQLPSHYTKGQAFEHVLKALEYNKANTLTGETSIYILPGYRFKVVDNLITNFHQPGSTLMLLVAAFAGPGWKRIYEEAISNNYRFLSYGDSSVLFKQVGD